MKLRHYTQHVKKAVREEDCRFLEGGAKRAMVARFCHAIIFCFIVPKHVLVSLTKSCRFRWLLTQQTKYWSCTEILFGNEHWFLKRILSLEMKVSHQKHLGSVACSESKGIHLWNGRLIDGSFLFISHAAYDFVSFCSRRVSWRHTQTRRNLGCRFVSCCSSVCGGFFVYS